MTKQRTYRGLCPQGTPEAVRRKHNIGDIFLNQAKCLVCVVMLLRPITDMILLRVLVGR